MVTTMKKPVCALNGAAIVDVRGNTSEKFGSEAFFSGAAKASSTDKIIASSRSGTLKVHYDKEKQSFAHWKSHHSDGRLSLSVMLIFPQVNISRSGSKNLSCCQSNDEIKLMIIIYI
ncbi:PREDICTED: uncharacterized protein LOC104724292 [Camelina sativa]|uniref:Uncharacterized protein LOC104724292 n=1 Tax=Camelina sativa TaxID=90675 RepID=A0ABM0UH35_CAMSA|nr:PREDICTED: uncharacterized protein LOC104724292 [Camelina sativa]